MNKLLKSFEQVPSCQSDREGAGETEDAEKQGFELSDKPVKMAINEIADGRLYAKVKEDFE